MDSVSIATAPNVSAQVSNIPMLIETDFQVWKVSVEIVSGCMKLDRALRTERPNDAEIENWDRSNRMCLMVMKRSIPEVFWSLVEKCNARMLLVEIEPYFAKNNNPEAAKLFADLISMKYGGEESENTRNSKWSLPKLISCVREEQRQSLDRVESSDSPTSRILRKRKAGEITCCSCIKDKRMKKMCPDFDKP